MEMPHFKPRAPTALAIATSATSPKKRKFSINNKSSFLQLKSFSNATAPATEERISGESPASCCSSNGSSPDENRITKFSDLEVDQVETSTCNCGEQRIRREIMSLSSELRVTNNNNNNSSSSQEVDSTVQTKTKSRRVLSPPPQKMPSESELEEFFAAAEKDIQKGFTEKYNYDIVKDLPLEGRYEWVKLKP